jgi:hypothetical protein
MQMIEPFPQDWQLIGLFECEPALADSDIPWVYNRLTFQTDRGDDRIACDLEPASEIIALRWWQRGQLRLRLDLRQVAALAVDLTPAREALLVTFRLRCAYLNPLEVQLRPELLISWGTSDDTA